MSTTKAADERERLVISYRQVIEAFPSGGGAYAVSGRHSGVLPWSGITRFSTPSS